MTPARPSHSLVRRVATAAAVAALLAGCAHRAAVPPRPAASPVAERAQLILTPLGLSPDGEARLLAFVRYTSRDGRRALLPPGGQVDITASRGSVQWQPRSRYGGPSAIVRLTEPGPLAVSVTSDIARVPAHLARTTDTRGWRIPPATAHALGPHSVVIGWFPRVHGAVVRIARRGGGPPLTTDVSPPSSSWHDPTVTPGAHYTYAVAVPDRHPVIVQVDMPPELPPSQPADISGTSMWFDADGLTRAAAIAAVDRAAAAGVHALLVRMTYGETATAAVHARASFDGLLDAAAQRGIRVIAWIVPRAVSFEDLEAAAAAAAVRSAAGNGIAGIAVDLERGADFMDTGGEGGPLARYSVDLRTAVGPGVLIVATVEDPVLENLPPGAVPYREIAESADVLQPMSYWRAQRRFASPAGLETLLRRSYAELKARSGGGVPIVVGAQTAALDPHLGAPPPAEVAASIALARELGALGVTLYDAGATTRAQWHAIGAQRWLPAQAER